MYDHLYRNGDVIEVAARRIVGATFSKRSSQIPGEQRSVSRTLLLASARLHGIEPHGYIRDLLCLIRTWPPDRLLELAPANWKQTIEQPETQQKLWPTSSDASRLRPLELATPYL